MLQFIRSAVGSWIVKILFVLLIVSFGVWGVGDMFRGGAPSSTTVAEVGPRSVGRAELDQEFRRQMERLRPLFGGALTQEQALQFGLVDQALNTIVQRSLFDLAAADAGLLVSDALIRQRIAEEPAFRDQAGRFDPNQFLTVLRSNGLSEPMYVALLREDIARNLVVGAVAGGATAPKPLVEALNRVRGEKRVAETVSIPNAAITDVSEPEQAVLQKYYDDHAVRFTAPEYRALTVAALTVDGVAKEVEVPEADLRAYYDEHSGEFQVPERRSVRMVLLDSEEKARTLAEAAKAGSFADAAKAAGVEPVALDQVRKQDLLELGDAAFALAKGQVSEALRSGLGWHVLEVTAIEPGSARGFDEVRDDILGRVRRDKALDRIFERTNKIEDQLAAGTPLEQIAGAQGMSIVTVPAVDASGMTPAGVPAESLPDRQRLVQTAFGLGTGQASGLLETPEHSFLVVRVDSVTPPRQKPLDEVRAEAVAAWMAEQRSERAAARANELATALKAGAEADAQRLAEQAGGSFAMTSPFTRDASTVEGLTPDLIKRLFEAKPGEVVTGTSGETQVVARLKEVIPADAAAIDPKLQTSVTQGIEGDLMAAFGAALRERYPVRIHQDRVAQMYAPAN